MESEQRLIIKFLANDGLGTDEIEEKLKTQFAKICTHVAGSNSGLRK
jgi:hypothetical protein